MTSIRQAVSFIGQRSLRLIALTFGLVESLTQGTSGKQFSDFWQRSLTIATVAAELARTTSDIAPDDAYSAGLLADMGELIFAQVEPERFAVTCENIAHGPELLAAERAEFGFAHPELGARLLQRWELPEELIAAVALHHVDEEDLEPLELAIRAGDLMADALWTPNSPQVAQSKSLIQEHFKLDLDGYIELAVCCQREISEGAEMFGVTLDGDIDCQMLLEEARNIHNEASLEAALDLDSLTAALEDPAVERDFDLA